MEVFFYPGCIFWPELDDVGSRQTQMDPQLPSDSNLVGKWDITSFKYLLQVRKNTDLIKVPQASVLPANLYANFQIRSIHFNFWQKSKQPRGWKLLSLNSLRNELLYKIAGKNKIWKITNVLFQRLKADIRRSLI